MFNKIQELLNQKWVRILLIIGLILFPLILFIFQLIPNKTSERLDIVNLLVQSEASVIAIVITLSLVAVQLASSSYSTRVIEIFRESRSFWTIVILYISAITISLVTLMLSNCGDYVIRILILIDLIVQIIII